MLHFPKKSSEKSGRRWLTHFNDPSLCSSKPIPCVREALLISSVQTFPGSKTPINFFYCLLVRCGYFWYINPHFRRFFFLPVLFGCFEIHFFSVAHRRNFCFHSHHLCFREQVICFLFYVRPSAILYFILSARLFFLEGCFYASLYYISFYCSQNDKNSRF